MDPSDEFLKHAADCQRMAKFTRDPESRATWNRMAERWIDCAERFKRCQDELSALHKRLVASLASLLQYRPHIAVVAD